MNRPENTELDVYVARRRAEFDRIDPARRAELEALAAAIVSGLRAGRAAVTFICTHNSRRSHFGQVWAQTAAAASGVERVETYSAGTEATAFHPHAVAALRRAGFDVDVSEPGENPVYAVRAAPGAPAMRCRSKSLADGELPRSGFVAVMTCTEADAACPRVEGAAARVALPYEDPKAFDGTAREAEAYDERCAQIAREMLYVFSRVAATGR